jgi:hypothetical protein
LAVEFVALVGEFGDPGLEFLRLRLLLRRQADDNVNRIDLVSPAVELFNADGAALFIGQLGQLAASALLLAFEGGNVLLGRSVALDHAARRGQRAIAGGHQTLECLLSILRHTGEEPSETLRELVDGEAQREHRGLERIAHAELALDGLARLGGNVGRIDQQAARQGRGIGADLVTDFVHAGALRSATIWFTRSMQRFFRLSISA